MLQVLRLMGALRYHGQFISDDAFIIVEGSVQDRGFTP